MNERMGVAGRLAEAFIHSKLTPLFIVASLALGAFAVVSLPREEEPQIVVPMIDVFVDVPGATSAEVEQRVTRPMEKLLWEVPGVEYLYSTSSPGQSMVVVRFYVGQDEERALVRVNQKLAANADRIPPGVSPPLVKARSIDDVPVAAVTLWGASYDDHQLREVAAQIREAIAEVPDVSEVTLIGGRPREVHVDVDPARLAAASLDPLRVARAVEELKEAGIWTVGLAGDAPSTYDKMDFSLPTAVVLGAEGTGLRRLVRERCDWLVSIPMHGHVQSLNVSVAAGIAVFEAVRQRRARQDVK